MTPNTIQMLENHLVMVDSATVEPNDISGKYNFRRTLKNLLQVLP